MAWTPHPPTAQNHIHATQKPQISCPNFHFQSSNRSWTRKSFYYTSSNQKKTTNNRHGHSLSHSHGGLRMGGLKRPISETFLGIWKQVFFSGSRSDLGSWKARIFCFFVFFARLMKNGWETKKCKRLRINKGIEMAWHCCRPSDEKPLGKSGFEHVKWRVAGSWLNPLGIGIFWKIWYTFQSRILKNLSSFS